jgi:hypothetical protein
VEELRFQPNPTVSKDLNVSITRGVMVPVD